MTKVFVAGSISLKKLHPLFVERLDRIVNSDFHVVVGDANGADKSIQQALADRHAKLVTVYCSGDEPRNNIGRWEVVKVGTVHRPGSRAFFTAKDVEMARIADYGLMMWDGKSPGTLSNVVELLCRERSSRVFVSPQQLFVTATGAEGLRRLLSLMPEEARLLADQKIGLSAKVAVLEGKQLQPVDDEGRSDTVAAKATIPTPPSAPATADTRTNVEEAAEVTAHPSTWAARSSPRRIGWPPLERLPRRIKVILLPGTLLLALVAAWVLS